MNAEILITVWPIVAFMVVQTVSVTWWAATITQRMKQLETEADSKNAEFNGATLTQRVVQLETDAKNHNGLGERMAKLETTLENVKDILQQLADDMKARRR